MADFLHYDPISLLISGRTVNHMGLGNRASLPCVHVVLSHGFYETPVFVQRKCRQ